MTPVEIIPIQDNLVLRARGSELLILAHHVHSLKKLTTPKEFGNYFMNDALINRPARKLFDAWLRKDVNLWQRIYKTIHETMELTAPPESTTASDAPSSDSQTVSSKASKSSSTKENSSKKSPKDADSEVADKKPASTKSKSAAAAKKSSEAEPEEKEAKKKTASTKKSATKSPKTEGEELVKKAAATKKKSPGKE